MKRCVTMITLRKTGITTRISRPPPKPYTSRQSGSAVVLRTTAVTWVRNDGNGRAKFFVRLLKLFRAFHIENLAADSGAGRLHGSGEIWAPDGVQRPSYPS